MGSIHTATPYSPRRGKLCTRGTFSKMWRLRRVTRKSLHFLVVSVSDWKWSKAGTPQRLSELEETTGYIQRMIVNRASQSPRVRDSISGDKGKAKGTLGCLFWLHQEWFTVNPFHIWLLPLVQSQCGLMFKATAVHQKNIIRSNSNLYSVSKEKAQGVEYMFNAHQVIFKIHHFQSLPFSISFTQMAAASWISLSFLLLQPD